LLTSAIDGDEVAGKLHFLTAFSSGNVSQVFGWALERLDWFLCISGDLDVLGERLMCQV